MSPADDLPRRLDAKAGDTQALDAGGAQLLP